MEIQNRIDLFNYLIESREYHSYLEIGVGNGNRFRQVEAPKTTGVDPNGKGTWTGTSDDYFAECPGLDVVKDLVFVDGLHEWRQVVRDVRNSLDHLSGDGLILIHDANPQNRDMATYPRSPTARGWHGDVWKAVLYLRTFADLDIATFAWEGLTVAVPRSNSNFQSPVIDDVQVGALSYEDLERNRVRFLNLLPGGVEELLAFAA